jgi:hypothetical protein
MVKELSPKGIEHVEFLLAEMELFRERMQNPGRPLDSNGKALEIMQLVEECSSRIGDVLEATR